MERDGLALQPVRAAPVVDPAQPDRRVDVEQDDEVWFETTGGPRRQPRDLVDRECPAGSLIGQGGVDIPVADHDLALVERRPDQRVDVVGAVCRVQQRLSPRRHRVLLRRRIPLQQQRPDPHPDPGRTGFPRHNDVAALGQQRLGEQLDLGRLAGTLPALEDDERPVVQVFPGDRERPAPQRPDQVRQDRNAGLVVHLPERDDADDHPEHPGRPE